VRVKELAQPDSPFAFELTQGKEQPQDGRERARSRQHVRRDAAESEDERGGRETD
jgi:hypothetical protein